MPAVKILKSGPLTTVQDEGRKGYQRFGMPVAGAMDKISYRAANLLAGNNRGAAVLEFTMEGPDLKFRSDSIISITGGDFSPRLNGCKIPMWQTIYVPAGARLKIGTVEAGLRGYIAFKGGLDIEEKMDSKSTYLKGKIGGYKGRKLQKDDLIKLNREVTTGEYCERIFPRQHIPEYKGHVEAGVILGPQDDHFTEKGIKAFLKERYSVTSQADRMGYRLEGPEINHRDEESADIISDGIPPGAVQVPGHKNPIIMMADRQTTGGYPKIASVTSVDLSRIAQLKPGETVSFKEVSLKEAQELLEEEENSFNEIEEREFKLKEDRFYRIKLEDRSYNVRVEEKEIEEN